jgi:hypothetical protein
LFVCVKLIDVVIIHRLADKMKVGDRSKRRKERKETSIQGQAHYFSEGGYTTSEALILNITPHGAGALISCPLQYGQMVKLRFPMPPELRLYDLHSSHYEIWGVVRFIGEAPRAEDEEAGDRYEIGIAFTGKDAPPEYLANPKTLFDLKPMPRRDGLWVTRTAPRVSDWLI